jgi:hypothetical protein
MSIPLLLLLVPCFHAFLLTEEAEHLVVVLSQTGVLLSQAWQGVAHAEVVAEEQRTNTSTQDRLQGLQLSDAEGPGASSDI